MKPILGLMLFTWASGLYALPLVRIPVASTWDAIGYPCTEIDAVRLKQRGSMLCVRYFNRFVDPNGYVQTRSEALWLPSEKLSIYDGENLFPKPFSSVDFSMVGEFGDSVELLPIRLVGDDSFLCVATRDFRSLNAGYSREVRYFIVPIVLLRLSHDPYIHSSDLSDRILKSYFVVSGRIEDNTVDKRDAVIRDFNVGESLPEWEYFRSLFQESFQWRRRAEPLPKAVFFKSCVDWILGRHA
jgi:hypothetical protein